MVSCVLLNVPLQVMEEAALAPDQLSAEKAAVAAAMLLPFDGAVKTDLPLLIGR